MDDNETRRTIAALKAIIQMLLPAVYPRDGDGGGGTFFKELLADDEPAAIAIANELSEDEIERAFEWAKGAHDGVDEELRAMPVIAYLGAEQVERVRVMLIAHDSGDEAIEVAIGAPDPPDREPLGLEERVRIGERSCLTALARDASSQRGGGLTQDAGRTIEGMVQALPEPWRRHGKVGLERIRGAVTAAVRTGGDEDSPGS